MNVSHESFLVFCLLSLFLVGSIIFLNGFFPATYDKISADSVEPVKLPTNIDAIKLNVPSRKYDQVIFMIIDALRNDFPSNASMPTVMANSCHSLYLHVDIPTVTMPRIKSMMTGTVSNFIDIIFNLGHPGKVEDSILHRLKENHLNIVFAGDDTWIKLFHNEFLRYEANNDSLFVQDFFEGDKKVTKSLETEVTRKDWNLLILHYLGLDHIGHVEGSISSKIPIKLKEMDLQVEKLIKSKDFSNRLLIITSDHGMRNGGGHGGSSPEETTVPLFIFNEECHKKTFTNHKYNQIDISPTLAMIFSIEIPKCSIGCLIPEFLNNFSLEDQLYFYHYNALHLIEQFVARFDWEVTKEADFYSWFSNAKDSHKTFLNSIRSNVGTSSYMFEKAKGDYIRVSEIISKTLAESMIKFDYFSIIIGLSLVVSTAAYALLCVLFDPNKTHLTNHLVMKKNTYLSLIFACLINTLGYIFDWFGERNFIKSLVLTVPLAASIYGFMEIVVIVFMILLPANSMRSLRLSLNLPIPYLSLFLFHTFSLSSSSFIEEEHQTWYYICPTLLLMAFAIGFWKRVRMSVDKEMHVAFKIAEVISKMKISVSMLLFLALLRRLNQTGDKWAHLPDVEDFLNKEENKTSLTMFVLFGLLNLILTLRIWLKPIQMTGAILAAIFIYCFRGMSGSLLFFSNSSFNSYSLSIVMLLFWICIGVIVVVPYHTLLKKNNYGYEPKSNIIEILRTNLSASLLVAAFLQKPHNIVLIPALTFTLRITYKLCDIAFFQSNTKNDKSYNLVQKTLMTICIANMFYFCQGNSNSLSTVDLNPGYLGQINYNPFRVACFVTLNTYSAQINAFLFLIVHMFEHQIKYLPQRQEKEQHSNKFVVETTDKDLNLVMSLYAALTMLPVAFYLCLLVAFRYHLFIYSVFAPKAFYVCYSVLVFYINFCATKLYFKLFKF